MINIHTVNIILLILITVTFLCSIYILKVKKYKRLFFSVTCLFLVIITLILFNITNLNRNDTLDRWESNYIEYNKIHNYSFGDSQTIALIDSGISESEESYVKGNYCFINDDSNYDTNGHGTTMLSILKGHDKLFSGIAPDCSVLSYKVMDTDGKSKSAVLAQAINHAIQNGATIINLSLGSYKSNSDVKKAIDTALSKNITVIASSGDYNTKDMLFPAKLKGVISVGSLNTNGDIWSDTNAPNDCDIIAPGVNVTAIDLNNDITTTTGTSQATILISGYVALLRDYCIKNSILLDNSTLITILNKINSKELTYTSSFEYLKTYQ